MISCLLNADSVVVPTSNMAMRRALLLLLLAVMGGLGPALVGSSGSPADNNNNKNTIRLGYLMYNRQTAMAIHLAIRRARVDGLLRGYNFR